MLEESSKTPIIDDVPTINIELKKIGTITYFAFINCPCPDGELCEDCGKTVTSINRLIYDPVYADRAKPIDKQTSQKKNVCDACLENYRTVDRDPTLATKLEAFNNNGIKVSVGMLSKTYTPHNYTCVRCKEAIDLYKNSIYVYEDKYYCYHCLKAEQGINVASAKSKLKERTK